MQYRTDLAVEGIENMMETGISPGEKEGVIVEKEDIDQDIKVTTIDIVNRQD